MLRVLKANMALPIFFAVAACSWILIGLVTITD
jgi:hypothetical protein